MSKPFEPAHLITDTYFSDYGQEVPAGLYRRWMQEERRSRLPCARKDRKRIKMLNRKINRHRAAHRL